MFETIMPIFEKLGISAILAVLVYILIKFLTGTLTDMIKDLKEIVIKLIDAINQLKQVVNSKWKNGE